MIFLMHPGMHHSLRKLGKFIETKFNLAVSPIQITFSYLFSYKYIHNFGFGKTLTIKITCTTDYVL